MSKVLSLHHIVFGTKSRVPAIEGDWVEDLHMFMTERIVKELCYVCRINSMPDHVHILIDLHPTKALSDVVGKCKSATSAWMKQSGHFPLFTEWCEGYYAASISFSHKDAVIDYIKNQQQHHADIPYLDEIQRLYLKSGLRWHPCELS